MARRRAYADEFARRLNRAAELLCERPPSAARRLLQAEYGLSERQARRYIRAAERTPRGVAVPERTVVFTVRLPPSVIDTVRQAAVESGRSLSATAADALRAGIGRGGSD
jgi:predicted transcriptional regulator